jgi:hypothetical protein
MRVTSTVLAAVKPPELIYNIASGLLVGRIGNTSISASAGSGGRAGSRTAGALNWWLANNPFATGVKLGTDKSHPGGPLPLGKYRIVPHEKRKEMLRLLPFDPRQMHGRDGMLIHGRGSRGSDGCIVPTDFAVVQLLCSLIRARQEAGQPAVVLQVIAQGQDLDRQLYTA